MATPLSDEIRALITFANETTEAGDTKLGDCVKTLCEGYNGGKNLPSSPLVVPQGAISSRLAALLAYANETTGAGDTTMGDAIRTLCEGYGGGELIFYESIKGDGTAYIMTGINAADDVGMWLKFAPTTTTDYSVMGGRQGNTSVTRFFIGKMSYIYAGYGSLYNLGTNKKDGTIYEVSLNMYNNRKAECPTNDVSLDITESSCACTREIYLVKTNRGGTASGNFVGKVYGAKITKGEELIMHLVPCTYNGEAGMWDLVSQTFFGNAASSGQFTVEGEIVYYDRLIGDGTAYIDTGVKPTATTSVEVDFTRLVSGDTIFGSSSGYASNYRLTAYNSLRYRIYEFKNNSSGTALHSSATIYANQRAIVKVSPTNVITENITTGKSENVTAAYGTAMDVSSYSIFLFGYNNANTPTISRSVIHSFMVYDGEKLLINLKPCTYNGEAGMWDMVGWKFYGNSNTSGAFTAENES